jgi:hypothetical protein
MLASNHLVLECYPFKKNSNPFDVAVLGIIF